MLVFLNRSFIHFLLVVYEATGLKQWERSSRVTVSFEEQILSKDNYSCMFPKPKVVYCLYYPSNIPPITREKKYLMDYKVE